MNTNYYEGSYILYKKGTKNRKIWNLKYKVNFVKFESVMRDLVIRARNGQSRYTNVDGYNSLN